MWEVGRWGDDRGLIISLVIDVLDPLRDEIGYTSGIGLYRSLIIRKKYVFNEFFFDYI